MDKPELDQETKLNQRLSVIKKYYDLDALLAHGTKQQDIAKYYRKSDFFYNHVHSGGGGNIHMAISSNKTFNRADFVRQADMSQNSSKAATKFSKLVPASSAILDTLPSFFQMSHSLHSISQTVTFSKIKFQKTSPSSKATITTSKISKIIPLT